MVSRKIVVVPYCRAWPAQFQQEADCISAALRLDGGVMHHIGSTAVPGLAPHVTRRTSFLFFPQKSSLMKG